jgi:hypothetical protein
VVTYFEPLVAVWIWPRHTSAPAKKQNYSKRLTTGAKETYYSVKETSYSVKMSRPTTVAKLLKEKRESKNVSERDVRTHAHAHTRALDVLSFEDVETFSLQTVRF